MWLTLLLVHFVLLFPLTPQSAGTLRFRTQEIDRTLKVGYSVVITDVNNDKKPDIVVADAHRVIWFENPTWKLRTIIQGQTKPDNVSIAAHDIDGDGQIDFALAADWKPFNTKSGGTLQWLKRGRTLDERWTVHPIAEDFPTIHRIRFVKLKKEDDKPELIVVPLMGRGSTSANNWHESTVHITAFAVPMQPARERWIHRVIDDSLHVVHNFDAVAIEKHGMVELICASYEGVSRIGFSLRNDRIGPGDQSQPDKNRGASEVKWGWMKDKQPVIATIEPWHGNQVVIYRPLGNAVGNDLKKLWNRTVIDKDLKWGHALAWADLNGDGQVELIAGVRDMLNQQHPCGVRVYSQQNDGQWKSQRLDPGGVAVEDMVTADLNGDGRPDIVAVGRATGNVRIYWNETGQP